MMKNGTKLPAVEKLRRFYGQFASDDRVLIVINADPDAAIFYNCDLGLTGDCKEIIPELIKAIEAYTEKDNA